MQYGDSQSFGTNNCIMLLMMLMLIQGSVYIHDCQQIKQWYYSGLSLQQQQLSTPDWKRIWRQFARWPNNDDCDALVLFLVLVVLMMILAELFLVVMMMTVMVMVVLMVMVVMMVLMVMIVQGWNLENWKGLEHRPGTDHHHFHHRHHRRHHHKYQNQNQSFIQSVTVGIAGGSNAVLNFCSNNYLGLSNHPEVVEAGQYLEYPTFSWIFSIS